MNRLEQAQAAARRSAEIAAARRAKIPGWVEPAKGEYDWRRELRDTARPPEGADIFYALKAARLAAQAGTSVGSPETAISDANSDPAHMLTA
ncbi:hypothetical protein ACWGOE_06480 [Leucobacter chromiiresistens]|uniref:hypothetical protein n=1 Tax=Microbacterium sp. 2RAF4 TaxID=3232999 RepID=UPI003F9E39DE